MKKKKFLQIKCEKILVIHQGDSWQYWQTFARSTQGVDNINNEMAPKIMKGL